jgi:hypothetical protein
VTLPTGVRLHWREAGTYGEKGRDLLLWLDGLGIGAAVWGGASMGRGAVGDRRFFRNNRVRVADLVDTPRCV